MYTMGPQKPTCLEVSMVNNVVFRCPKPLIFIVLGGTWKLKYFPFCTSISVAFFVSPTSKTFLHHVPSLPTEVLKSFHDDHGVASVVQGMWSRLRRQKHLRNFASFKGWLVIWDPPVYLTYVMDSTFCRAQIKTQAKMAESHTRKSKPHGCNAQNNIKKMSLGKCLLIETLGECKKMS